MTATKALTSLAQAWPGKHVNVVPKDGQIGGGMKSVPGWAAGPRLQATASEAGGAAGLSGGSRRGEVIHGRELLGNPLRSDTHPHRAVSWLPCIQTESDPLTSTGLHETGGGRRSAPASSPSNFPSSPICNHQLKCTSSHKHIAAFSPSRALGRHAVHRHQHGRQCPRHATAPALSQGQSQERSQRPLGSGSLLTH